MSHVLYSRYGTERLRWRGEKAKESELAVGLQMPSTVLQPGELPGEGWRPFSDTAGCRLERKVARRRGGEDYSRCDVGPSVIDSRAISLVEGISIGASLACRNPAAFCFARHFNIQHLLTAIPFRLP